MLNAAPIAVPDPWYSTPVNTQLSVTSQGTTLLQNDGDPEGHALAASLVSGPSNGSLSGFFSDGTFTYTPNSGFTGFDTFSYRVSDGTDNSNVVEATVAVGGRLGPRTNRDGSVQDLSLYAGSLEQGHPITPSVSLVYQSDTQANAIVVVETSLQSGAPVPDEIRARLTFNGTTGTQYSYNTYGLAAGNSLRFALQADTSSLATGHYDWSMDVTLMYSGVGTVHTFSGSQDVVNRNGASAPYGRGWQLAGLDALVSQANGALVVRSNGSTLWFAHDGAGGFLRAEGDATYSTLVRNVDQTCTLSDTHGNQTHFSSTGQLTSRVDANGNTVGYSYTNGLLTQITDPFSRATTLSYTGGRLSAVTDFAGRAGSLAYDGSGRLSSITQPDPDGAGALTAPVTSFSYDAGSHRLTGVTNALSQTTSFAYGSHGRLTTQTNPDSSTRTFSYNSADQVTGETDELQHTTSFAYDQLGRLTSRTDRTSAQTSFVYNAIGLLVQETDALSQTTDYTYNNRGWLTQKQLPDPDGAGPLGRPTSTYGYGPTGLVTSQGEPSFQGVPLQFTYDAAGRMTQRQHQGDTFSTTYTYDNLNRLIKEVDPELMSTSTTYNGQTTASISYNATAAAVQSALEALSNVDAGDVVVSKLQDSTSAQEWQLEFGGDLGGANLVQTTINTSGVWGMGSVVKIEATDADGSSGSDEVQRVTLSNATGGTFRLAFAGYVTAPLDYNASAAQVETALEALGSVDNITVTGSAGGPWSVTFIGTHSGTDVARLDGDASAATAGTLERTISMTYDAAGRLTAASDPDSSYAFTYDALGRVTSVDNNNTPGVPRVVLSSAYDVASNRTSLAATVSGTSDFLNEYTHDALHRLTRVDQVGQSGGNAVAEKRVDLAYNGLGQFTSIARYKDTDGGTTHEVATAAFSYDALARLTGLAYSKGGTNLFTPYSWTYDSLSSAGMQQSDQLGDSRVAATAAAAVQSVPGRVTRMVSQDGTSDYGYDSKSQLTSATHTYQTNESYSYDNNGNRTMTGYQTGDDNRLTNDGTYSYQYDAEGNRTRRTKSATGEVTEYAWDYRNRLVKVTEKNSQGATTQVVEYTYDVFNRRIGKEVDSSSPFDMADAAIERYAYDDIHNGLSSADGGNVVLDFVDSDGGGAQPISLLRRYLHGESVDQILAQEDLSKTLNDAQRVLWPLVDNLGTVRDLAKQDGTIAAHYIYDTYGNVTSGDTSQTRYLFTGREWDAAVDLQYNRARWYDAEVGRWLSEDPLGFVAGDANLQRYVGNAPAILIDPSGLQPPYSLYPGYQGIQAMAESASARVLLPLPPFPPAGETLQLQTGRAIGGGVGHILSGYIWSYGRDYWLTQYRWLDRDNLVPAIPANTLCTNVMADPGIRLIGPDGNDFIGPFGCHVCVGVIVVVPDCGAAIFHFSPSSNAIGTIGQWRWPSGSHAVVCGGQDQSGSRSLYDDVIHSLHTAGIKIDAVTPEPRVYVGPGQNGEMIWYMYPGDGDITHE